MIKLQILNMINHGLNPPDLLLRVEQIGAKSRRRLVGHLDAILQNLQ